LFKTLWRITQASAQIGKRGAPFGPIARRTKTRSAQICYRCRQRGHAMWERSERERYDPDLWTDEFAFLNQPAQAQIQSDLFYDYRTNVDAYPKWQAWMREKQPRLLVIWGKYGPLVSILESRNATARRFRALKFMFSTRGTLRWIPQPDQDLRRSSGAS